MAFNKPLPASLWPKGGTSRRYYFVQRSYLWVSRTRYRLPRISTATWFTGRRGGILGDSSSELRKDRPFSFANPLVRVYLDNYDQLTKVDAKMAALVEGTPTVETLSLRAEYESWGVPNHPKKSVVQQPVAEVQGAIVDGVEGIAYPKKEKVLKYTHLAFLILKQGRASLKQIQVVGGGLVYLAMFRRPLLGCLTLRVSLDALGISCIGHVSIETSPQASRVVESHFPGTIFCSDVTQITESDVTGWACTFSQCAVIIIGAGPPCQGVSGLNSERNFSRTSPESLIW